MLDATTIASLSLGDRKRLLTSLTEDQRIELLYDWRHWARPKQLAPEGDWAVWILTAGRGFGKTHSNAQWLHKRSMEYPKRWSALVVKTPADARDMVIEGPGGILRNTHPKQRPLYEPSKRRLTWSNESWATIFSDEEPDQLRGFSGDTAAIDEFAKFKHPQEVWDNLQFGMRALSNDRPRILVTTTPRPIKILKKIMALPTTIVVTGSSYENRANLDPTWFDQITSQYEGTRLGRQEIHAEILDDVPGALWTRVMLDKACYRGKPPEFRRVVVGVDPSGTSGDDHGNRVGIVAVGLSIDGICYVLADRSCSLGPDGWGRRVVDTLDSFNGDRIVVERNFGGAMAEHVIRTVRQNAPLRMVTASRGKIARADPVAALYEQGKVRHLASVPDLEDEMCNMTSDGYIGGGSPDRCDALVWAITELVLKNRFEPPPSVALPIFGS
jgi:phage terminase large subunit-like protein